MSIDYYGLPTISLENAHLRIDALANAGPRLVRAMLHGATENQFAELPGLRIDTALGPYSIQGGHRLWHAPEAMPRTYVPDNIGVISKLENGTLSLTGAIETYTSIQKSMTIRLLEDRPGLQITHTLLNKGAWSVELACWGITQLPLGGIAILPQSSQMLDTGGLLPNRSLVLWPYSHWNDARLHLHDDMLLVRGDSQLPPLKVGYTNSTGWIGYLRNGILFSKRFETNTSLPYPDRNCNTEVYVNHLFLELETLGNLVRLPPNQCATLTETWEFFPGLTHIPLSLKGARALVHDFGLPG